MTALEVIRLVQVHGGELMLEEGRLRVRGPAPLPDSLMAALSEHKAEVMVALGAPLDAVVASVLGDIRPHLAPALQRLPDDRLLVLVNWSIIAAWRKALDSFPWEYKTKPDGGTDQR